MSEPLDEQTRAARTVVVAFAVGLAGAVLFMVIFALDANTQLLGIALGLALGGIGYGLVVWGHRLMPSGGEYESREMMADPPASKQEAVHEFEGRLAGVGRRRLLGGALATALGASGIAVLFPLRSLGPRPGDALRRTEFSLAPRPRLITESGAPIHRDDLPVGGFLTVYPEGHPGSASAQTALVRLDMDRVDLRPPTRREWVVEGYIAYSKICTHAGCAVGEYQVEFQTLLCPCHFSSFQLEEGGRPILGPADRALPQLPLGLDDDGYLIALDDYPEAVGPGWWTRP